MEQLPDIAGPVMLFQLLDGLARDREFSVAFPAQPAQIGKDDGADVFLAGCERRDLEQQGIDPVEQVLPELPLPGHGKKVPVRRTDDADIHLHEAGAPQAGHDFVLQDPQQAGLQAQRHLPYLVKEQGPAVGQLHQPRLAPAPGAGEGPLFITKKFAFQQALGHGRTVDGNKGRLLPPAVRMDGLGEHLLARARIADQQYWPVAVRETLPHELCLSDDGTVADDVVEHEVTAFPFLIDILPYLPLIFLDIDRIVQAQDIAVKISLELDIDDGEEELTLYHVFQDKGVRGTFPFSHDAREIRPGEYPAQIHADDLLRYDAKHPLGFIIRVANRVVFIYDYDDIRIDIQNRIDEISPLYIQSIHLYDVLCLKKYLVDGFLIF